MFFPSSTTAASCPAASDLCGASPGLGTQMLFSSSSCCCRCTWKYRIFHPKVTSNRVTETHRIG